jgi:hypothetical protein
VVLISSASFFQSIYDGDCSGMPQKKHQFSRSAVAAALLGVVVCSVLSVFLIRVFGPLGWQGDDFPEFYTAGKLATSAELYSPSVIHAMEAQHHGGMFSLPFLRPPFYAGLLWPLSGLRYPLARWLWGIASAIAAMAAVWLWEIGSMPRRFAIAAWLFPFSFAIVSGQDSVFVLLLAVLMARFLAGERPAAAGVMLALCTIKYHLFTGVVVYLIGARRWRTLIWAGIGVAIETGASFWLQGSHWPGRYLALLRQPGSDIGVRGMPTLRGLFSRMPATDLLEIAGVLVLLGLLWFAAGRIDVFQGTALALGVGLLAGRHAYPYDLVLLFPMLTGAAETRGYPRLAVTTLLVPPVYILPWIAGLTEWSFLVSQVIVLGAIAVLLWRGLGHSKLAV